VRISIIVPSLNQAAFIGRALESIFSQQGDFDLECLVLDGGSTDGSIDVIRAFATRAAGSKIAFQWRSEPDRGQSDAINRGLAAASGDLIAYLNSDDMYAPDALDEVARAVRATGALWVTGPTTIVDADDRPIQRAVNAYRNLWLRRYSYRKLLMLNFVPQPSTFWTREALDQIGTFNEQLHYTMDYDYWLRLGRIGDPIVLDRPLSRFRIHGGSKGGTRYAAQFEEGRNVMRRYTTSRGIRLFHGVHSQLIVLAYRIFK
jgi:glycosyltransferase involved in cell wall biosynthesis